MGQAVLEQSHLIPDPLAVSTFDHACYNREQGLQMFCIIRTSVASTININDASRVVSEWRHNVERHSRSIIDNSRYG